jgi:hypothetical protein
LLGATTDPRVGITAIHKDYCYYVADGYLTKWNPNIPPRPGNSNLNLTDNTLYTYEVKKLEYRVAFLRC